MGSIDKACISGFLCRLCSEMHRIVIHIYGDQGQRLCLVEKINGYLPITISPTDPLPKTICTTCLRRVEQHYDLLMRLSRIKEERFLRVNNKQRPRVSPISSIENSEDEVYQSDDESRRRQLRQDATRSEDTQSLQNILSSPTPAAASSLISASANAGSLNRTSLIPSAYNDEADDGANDVRSEASTSARAMAAISHRINETNDTNIGDSSLSSSTSSSSHNLSIETGNSFSIAVQQHSD